MDSYGAKSKAIVRAHLEHGVAPGSISSDYDFAMKLELKRQAARKRALERTPPPPAPYSASPAVEPPNKRPVPCPEDWAENIASIEFKCPSQSEYWKL